MPKVVHDDLLNAPLNKIATATDIALCAGDPGLGTVGFANAEKGVPGANHVANKVTATGAGNGVYGAIADGSPDGRTITIAEFTTENAVSDGPFSVDHIAFMDATHVLYVTILAQAQTVLSGNPVTVPSFPINPGDPE